MVGQQTSGANTDECWATAYTVAFTYFDATSLAAAVPGCIIDPNVASGLQFSKCDIAKGYTKDNSVGNEGKCTTACQVGGKQTDGGTPTLFDQCWSVSTSNFTDANAFGTYQAASNKGCLLQADTKIAPNYGFCYCHADWEVLTPTAPATENLAEWKCGTPCWKFGPQGTEECWPATVTATSATDLNSKSEGCIMDPTTTEYCKCDLEEGYQQASPAA